VHKTGDKSGDKSEERAADRAGHLLAIMAASRRIHEAMDLIDTIVSEQLGVHRSDLRCLHLLEKGPATPGEIAATTRLTSGSVTALVDRLETAGLAERRRSCADRRSVEIAVPTLRLAEIRALYAIIERTIQKHFGGQADADLTAASRALETFAEALNQCALGFAHRRGGDD
jgi:DNA-binding MarR family transcriptional regulator